MKRILAYISACIVLALVTGTAGIVSAQSGVKQYSLKVVKEYPHDVTSYTQGLFFYDGNLYESTGGYGTSTFRKVDMQTGKPLRRLNFDKKYFVEGSVVLNDNLYILTWTSRVAFIYDAMTLKYKSSVSYPRQGWGLTTDGTYLIASDGSSTLYFMDERLKVQKTVSVKLNGSKIAELNELEYIGGKIWANVYTLDLIVIIDPGSGKVEAVVDCTGLLPESLKDADTDVLNGIAYDPSDKKIYLTGKNWKRMYEIALVEQ